MIYITGDTHGSFERVENFCQRFNTKNDDIMIILGDAGINFSGPRYDRLKKRQLEELPITIFAIHGNHEQRPFTIESYKEQVWNGGMVYYEEEFPSILFAKDGEVSYDEFEAANANMQGKRQSKKDKCSSSKNYSVIICPYCGLRLRPGKAEYKYMYCSTGRTKSNSPCSKVR